MYGLNAFALILFAAVNILAVQLCKCDEATRTKMMRMLCLALLLFNIGQYALLPLLGARIKIPVEFSTVAYFAVPIILLSGKKCFQSWAAYSGLMAGFFYYMAMVTAGGPIYRAYPPLEIYISMCCHGTLYICGFVTVGTQLFSEKDKFKLLGCVAYVAARALVLRPLVEGTERLFIYELLDGIYIKQLSPQTIWNLVMPAYYTALIFFILLSVRGFIKLNSLMYKKYAIPRRRHLLSFSAV